MSSTGASSCSSCSSGKYVNYTGATYCFTCEEGYQAQAGSEKCDMCAKEYMMVRRGCEECTGTLAGADCSREGETLEFLTLKPGYWRTGPFSDTLLECDNSWACLGGNNTATQCKEGE